jgi:FkbM family methyltransferase
MAAYPRIRASHAQYFPPGVVTFAQEGVVVDGGGFDGDTLRSFAAHNPDARNPYYAFEPDPSNYARLVASGARYAGPFFPVNAGLGATEATLAFSAGGGMDSTFTGGGPGVANLSVPVHAIDRFFPDGTRTTFIKMDIEGMEPEALRGAEETIRAHAPTLAICVYHRPEHLWEIPQLVRGWRPDYRLYLRHYSTNMSETVMYAVAGRQ